jgi:hypothetical protein
VVTASFQRRLEEELERLKRILKRCYELRVRWLPNVVKGISGEVKSGCILIYDEDEMVALETLKHEFVDYALSRMVEPYKEFTNQLIALINNMAYERKEGLVDALAQLI